MEWSKDKTLKLIELLQVNATLWNPSLCDTRRDKQKRREELRLIAELLGISLSDATKKIQHLRTQYNRESAREVRAYVEDPYDRYVSNWYAFEYLHFLKDSSKPYRIIQSDDNSDWNSVQSFSEIGGNDVKLTNLTPPQKMSRNSEALHSVKSDTAYSQIGPNNRDEFSVFGEYIANELRSLKGEKNLLVAKKKIQDVIYDVKMSMISEHRAEQPLCRIFTNTTQPNATVHNGKHFNTPVITTIASVEPLSTSHTPSTTEASEIVISNNTTGHYPNFKVDTQ